MNEFSKYAWLQVYDLDVWESEEGYTVNDIYKGTIYAVPKDYDEHDILALLQSEGYIKDFATLNDIDLQFNEDFVEVFDADTYCPLYQLWEVSPDDLVFEAKSGTKVIDMSDRELHTWKDGTYEFV